MTDIGDRLAAERRRLGWTLRKAERRSGVPNAHISQLETGRIKTPGTGVLIRLAAAYDTPLAELLGVAGRADFGTIGADGRLEDYDGHDLWRMSVYLPDGREAEAVAWMTAHGIEVYRMQKAADLTGGARAAEPPDVADAAVRAAVAAYRDALSDESMTLGQRVRRMLEAALPHLPAVRLDLHLRPWRQGRHEPRHLYAQLGLAASDDDPIVGTLDTPEASAEACTAHNERLEGRASC